MFNKRTFIRWGFNKGRNFLDMKNIKNSIVIKTYHLQRSVCVYYPWQLSTLYLKNRLGLVSILLPSFYFSKATPDKIYFTLSNIRWFKSFVNHIFTFYNSLFNFYYVKIKIRGLGYRLREIIDGFYYFFFNFTNYYYLQTPDNLFISMYKKRLLIVSLNWQVMKLVLSEILLLKTLGPYRLRGIRIPRQIILLKKSGKTV